MSRRIILFVLGNLFLKNGRDGRLLPSEGLYKYETGDGAYPGIQANEAPVEYLIQAGYDSGNPITDLVYLCPDSCRVPNVPIEQAIAAIPGFKAVDKDVSTEEFFLARLNKYCAEHNFAMPAASPMPFNPLRPADSLSNLVDALGTGSHISIDITGGPRDAVILLTLVTQIIKMGVRGTTVGEILYTNFNEKTVYRQNNSFELIDLVNAIDSFTEYGRADQLKAFFDGNPYIKEPTKRLCRAMEAFSDALALCQVEDIESKVLDVQRYLDEAEFELGKQRKVYALCANALEQIGRDSRGQSFLDAIDEIGALNPVVVLSGLDNEALARKLDELRRASMMNRSELLFLSLIPAIREKFVPATNDQASLSLELIKWCSRHQMVVQALCIYRERIGQCLLEKGYFTPLEAASGLSDEARSEQVCDLLLSCSFEYEGLYLGKVVKVKGSKERKKTPHPYFKISETKEDQLRLPAIWFRYLHATRNTIVHADGDRGSFAYFFAMEFLGKDRDEAVDLSILREDILESVEAIESPQSISIRDWQSPRSAAFNDMNRYRQRSADGSNKADVSRVLKTSQQRSGTSLGSLIPADTQAKLAALRQSAQSY